MNHFIRAVCSVCVVVTLTQCSDFKATEKNTPVVKLTKPGAQQEEVWYTEAYQKIVQARKLERGAPGQALALYLDAAKQTYQSKNDRGLALYGHAVGQVADLVVAHPALADRVRLLPYAGAAYTWSGLDDVIPADCIQHKGWREHVRQQGVGAPLVLVRSKATVMKTQTNFVIPGGHIYPATAVLEFPRRGKPVLRLYDPSKTTHVRFWNKRRVLANDFTAALGISTQDSSSRRREILMRWFGVFTPTDYVDKMGLYMTTPFDAEKVPVVLVHGIKSDPMTWRNVINELNADPVLRRKYQFLAFYYPTGLPLRVSSARLKHQIHTLYEMYRKKGRAGNGNQMVIIGHSLGGLLTSVQARKIDPSLIQKIFKNPIDQKQANQSAMKDYRYLLEGPKPTFVKRVVFVATPHRGSKNADIYLVRLLSSLVEIPKNLLFLQVPETTAALTDFGRSLFGSEEQQNSISLLQSESTVLSIIRRSPFRPHIKYHSIVGDRGKGDSPNSSDGLVAYSSSHLAGAESELVVPSGHSAHHHPKAIQEMRRILRLHLND